MKGMVRIAAPMEHGEQVKMPKVYLCTGPSTSTTVGSSGVQQFGGEFPFLPALSDHIYALQNCLYLAGVAAVL